MNYTEPSDQMGVKISRVNYALSVEGAADWTKLPAIQKAFPELARSLEPKAEAAALILTNEGWVHEQDFQKAGGF